MNGYLSDKGVLSKPESRGLKDMTVGILKSKSVFINQIAASLREPVKLKKVAKRLSEQYLKEDFAGKVRENHLKKTHVGKDEFIILDGSDISKKHARTMEGQEWVRDGDTGKSAFGYNLTNINSVNAHNEITPLYSKAYSYQVGALSSNNEIKKGMREVMGHTGEKGTWIFDRGMDNQILKSFFFEECPRCIVRLKKNTKVTYKGEDLKASQVAGCIELPLSQKVVKIKRNKKVRETYELGARQISFKAKGKTYNAWLVVTRNTRHGGMSFLLVKTDLNTAVEVAKWAFKGYGKRWKIEEYHRHIKQAYNLEDIQIKTFSGLQSILAVLTVAMYIIYKKIKAIHLDLLLDSRYDYLNKHVISELTNFIYYKISKIVSTLLMPVRTRWKTEESIPISDTGQVNLMFN